MEMEIEIGDGHGRACKDDDADEHEDYYEDAENMKMHNM